MRQKAINSRQGLQHGDLGATIRVKGREDATREKIARERMLRKTVEAVHSGIPIPNSDPGSPKLHGQNDDPNELSDPGS